MQVKILEGKNWTKQLSQSLFTFLPSGKRSVLSPLPPSSVLQTALSWKRSILKARGAHYGCDASEPGSGDYSRLVTFLLRSVVIWITVVSFSSLQRPAVIAMRQKTLEACSRAFTCLSSWAHLNQSQFCLYIPAHSVPLCGHNGRFCTEHKH